MLEPIVRKNAFGGKGEVILRPLLTDEQKKEKVQMYAEVTIPKGASLGVHRHTGNAESYYILAGTGLTPTTEKPMKSMRATRHTAPMAITTDLKIRETAT